MATSHAAKDSSDADTDVQTVFFDEPVDTRIVGLEPNQRVTLRASMSLDGGTWESQTAFRANEAGVVDVASQEPVEGEYDTADPMGPFWSMQPVSDRSAYVENEYVRDTTVALTVETNGETFGSTEVKRVFAASGVTRSSIHENGLVAEFYRPAGVGPHPGVIRIGGSGGGFPPRKSTALLASHGYAVLNVVYFGVEDLPDSLELIPLEYFQKAIDWLTERKSVIADPLGAIGGSRGGELALLLGAQFPEITTVVASVPSGVVFPGIPQDFASGEPPKPAWTLDGEPLARVPYSSSGAEFLRQAWRMIRRKPFEIAPTYSRGLEEADSETVAAATIPVENIGGPVLLVSGTDDRMWPSPRLAEIARKRLEAHDYPHPYEHRQYEGAGHAIATPYRPTMGRESTQRIAFGGTPEGYAHADAHSWSRILTYLEAGLRD
jgi:dienelactone hydrolase